MTLISQTLSPLTTPGLREAMLFGGDREDWQRVFDEAASFRHDDSVLSVLESEARREERRREQERRLIWCMPAPVAASVARPHIFRALFQRNIGGVAGASDVWVDADFTATDGVTGKMQSWVDYIDNAHVISQTSSGQQCVVPTTDASFAGARSAVFTGGQHYGSNRGVALWAHEHDGSGGDTWIVFVSTSAAVGVLFATLSDASPRGVQIYTGSGNTTYRISNGTSNLVIQGIAGGAPLNTATYSQLSYAASATPQLGLYAKSVAITGAAANAPSALTSVGPLRIGSQVGGGFPISARIRSLYNFRRPTSAASQAIVRAWIQRDTGVPP